MSEPLRRASNREKVLAALQARRVLTNVEIVQIGGIRGMARIHELQREYDIHVEHVRGGLWQVRYRGKLRPGQQVLDLGV